MIYHTLTEFSYGAPAPDAIAHVACGFLGCDLRPFNPLIATLPRSQSNLTARISTSACLPRKASGVAVLCVDHPKNVRHSLNNVFAQQRGERITW